MQDYKKMKTSPYEVTWSYCSVAQNRVYDGNKRCDDLNSGLRQYQAIRDNFEDEIKLRFIISYRVTLFGPGRQIIRETKRGSIPHPSRTHK